jgi:dTDP-glucose 4,6-dehydratase
MILVTGGAGFIGSNLVMHLIASGETVLNLDKLTYAGNLHNLASVNGDRYIFVEGDIGNHELVTRLLAQYQPRAVLNLAAESHVDRSIHEPESFIQTNIVGTFRLWSASLAYWTELPSEQKSQFRFLHVSTDEVYGTLAAEDAPFSETTAYAPNSPYAASKAASDHLVRSYFHTYGLPVVTTNCSNNYGPYQFPEKLIPLVIHNALVDKTIPVYGDGQNIRDWLYVSDHCAAINRVLERGRLGETYNIGGASEKANIDIVKLICGILDEERARSDGKSYKEQITFVKDRPGHDRRYAIDARKMRDELGWVPTESFDTGIRKTVKWYLENQDWVRNVTTGAYRDWIAVQYDKRSESTQGSHSRGRVGNATVSPHQGRVETASADL